MLKNHLKYLSQFYLINHQWFDTITSVPRCKPDPLISKLGFCTRAPSYLLHKYICNWEPMWFMVINGWIWFEIYVLVIISHISVSVFSFPRSWKELSARKLSAVRPGASPPCPILNFPPAKLLFLHLWTWITLSPEGVQKAELHTSPPPTLTRMITSELPVLQWAKRAICRKREFNYLQYCKNKL